MTPSRTRFIAAVSGLAFLAVSVLGIGVLATNAAPPDPAPTPVITIPSDNDFTTVTSPVIEFDTIETEIGVTVYADGNVYCTLASTFSSSGGECSGAALPYGNHTFTAVSDYTLDPSDPSAPSTPVNVMIYSNQGPSISFQPVGNIYDSTPTFAGFGPTGGTIAVYADGQLYCQVPVIAQDGSWICFGSAPLPAAAYPNVQASGTDYTGASTGDAFGSDFAVIQPPAPTMDQSFSPWITGLPKVTMEGTKDPDVSQISIQFIPNGDGNIYNYCQIAVAIGDTAWQCNEPTGFDMPYDTVEFQAFAYNEAGDVSTGSTPTVVVTRHAPPAVLSPANGTITNDTTPTFSGDADPGTTSVEVWTSDFVNLCDDPAATATWGCTSSALTDGVYQVRVIGMDGPAIASSYNTITIDTVAPAAATITGPGTLVGPTLVYSSSSPFVTVDGIAEPNAFIQLYADGAPLECPDQSHFADGGGSFSCSFSSLDFGAHAISVQQTDSAGNVGPVSGDLLQINLIAPLLPMTGPIPTPTPAPAEETKGKALMILIWSLDWNGGDLLPGDILTLTGSGLPTGAVAAAEIHSTPQALGTAMVDDAGTFTIDTIVPEDIEPGDHTIVVTVTADGAEQSVVNQPVVILAPEDVKSSGPKTDEPKIVEDDAAGSDAGTVDRNAPNAPSSMTSALDTVLDIIGNPVVIGSAAAIGLGLLLFVAVPAELLNATLSEQYGRITKRIPRLKKSPGWWAALTAMLSRTPVVGAIVITALTAVIFGFADPRFGFDLTSLRVVLACALGLLVVGFVANALTGIAVAKRWGISTRMEIKPLGILLAVIGVLLSRLLDFSPGFLIGLLLGIALIGKVGPRDEVRTTLTKSGILFGFAILAWLVYSFTGGLLTDQSFGANLFLETMVAITTEGLTALLIGLLPFKFLEGESLWKFSKPLWVGIWLFVAAAFALIVVPNNFAQVNGSLWVWGIVVAGFAVVAIGLYVYFRFFAPPIEEDESVPEEERVGSRR